MRFAILLVLLLAGCGPDFNQGFNHSCVVNTSSGGLGTGVLVRSNLVLTAAHNIDTNLSGEIEDYEKNVELSFETISRVCSGTAIKIGQWAKSGMLLDSASDLALIKLNEDIPCSLKFSKDYSLGDSVYAIGSPAGPPLHISTGVVSSKYSKSKMSSCAIYPGNSGGGMFNFNGELIGIVTRVKTDTKSYELQIGNRYLVWYDSVVIPHCSVFIEMKDVFEFLGDEYILEHNNRKKNALLACLSLIGLVIYVFVERELLSKSLRRV